MLQHKLQIEKSAHQCDFSILFPFGINVDKKADISRLMSASPMGFRHMDACAGHMASGYNFLYLLKPAIRQNSYGLYIVESLGDEIIGNQDRNVLR